MNDNNKMNKTNTGSSLAAGIAIGAALGAAAVALKDKKNQDKVKHTVDKVKKWADDTSKHFTEKSDEIMKDAQDDLDTLNKEVKEPEKNK